MKIGFVVPDGFGVKNYIYSAVFQRLVQQNHEVVVIHALGTDFENIIKQTNPNVQFLNLTLVPEGFFIRLLREAISFARLKFNAKKVDNPTILRNWKKFHNISLQKKVLYKTAEIFGRLLTWNYKFLVAFEKQWFVWNKKSSVYQHWVNTFQKSSFDKLILTHQRVPEAIPVLQAAADTGAQTFVAIFSWDNMPKARLSARGERYLVWSNYMKKEFQLFHPEIKQETIDIVGSPQFEYYHNPEFRMTREAFANLNGLDIHKKWICFSGDDLRTSPFDQNYLEDLCEEITKLDVANQLQILVRPAPADLSGRFDFLSKKYSFVKMAKLGWLESAEQKKWTTRIPLKEDITILTSTVLHCEAVVNVGSTMALDFFNLRKPAFYIRYDRQPDPNWSVETIYSFQHFRSMENLDPVYWVTSKSKWKELILGVTEGTLQFKEDSTRWLQRVNEYEQQGGADNFIKVITS